MDVEELKIRPHEVSIDENGSFNLVLHPKTMDSGVVFDRMDAKRAFAETPGPFYNRLLADLDSLGTDLRKQMKNEFLRKTPYIKVDKSSQIVEPYKFDDYANFRDNGLATCLSVRGGSTHSIIIEQHNEVKGIGRSNFNVSPEKMASYSTRKIPEDQVKNTTFIRAFVWSHWNMDTYGGARFLMEWGINYNNRLLDYLHEKGKI